MTLEIPTELSQEIQRAATQSGTDAQTFVLNATRAALENRVFQLAGEQGRHAAIDAGFGMFAGRGRSADDFLAERHAEGETEYQKWLEQHQSEAR